MFVCLVCTSLSKFLQITRSPLTPDLSADELPDDITSDISDIPHDLELNQEDFSDVLSRFPDDLQDFDLFEGSQTCMFFRLQTKIYKFYKVLAVSEMLWSKTQCLIKFLICV